MATEAAEKLRERARDYELNAIAARERGNTTLATYWSLVAVALYEVAAALDADD